MKIATGNFANVKKYREAGYYTVSIALSARYYSGASIKELAPKREWIDEPENVYTPIYKKKILSKLNPLTIFNRLKALSSGENVVLLCHEKEGDFCHRRIVAKWLEENLSIEVPELGKTKPKDLFAGLV